MQGLASDNHPGNSWTKGGGESPAHWRNARRVGNNRLIVRQQRKLSMLVDKITSKEQLIKALADELDDCFDLSYPVVDLTGQIVTTGSPWGVGLSVREAKEMV